MTPTPTPATGTTAPTQPQTNTQPQTTTQPQTQNQTTPQSSAGGGAAAPDANPTPQPGADAQKFEAFCQQNPGAC